METVPCILCGTEDAEVVFRQADSAPGQTREFTVVGCVRCGLLYLNPRPKPESLTRYYPAQYFSAVTISKAAVARRENRPIKRWLREDFYGYPAMSASDIWRSIRRWLLWPEWARRLLQGRDILPWVGEGRVLDVGCGPGSTLIRLEAQGWDVYGIDTSPMAVDFARRFFEDRIRLGSLEATGFPDSFFDVILFNHSLEHVRNPVQTLRRPDAC